MVPIFHACQFAVNLDAKELARGDLDRFAPEPHHVAATRRQLLQEIFLLRLAAPECG
jgi:hypothetical protein